jgi:hypothetical protein
VPAASKILVVYYTRSGTTGTIAAAIARATGARVERLIDTTERSGARGFLRSLVDTLIRRPATLTPLSVDPIDQDLVIIGTPDWGRSVCAPVRAFLEEYRGRLRQVAFFLTDGERDHDAVFHDMARLIGAQPVAVLGVPSAEVKAEDYGPRVQAFVSALPIAAAAAWPERGLGSAEERT